MTEVYFYEFSSFLGSSYSWGPSGVYFRTLKLLSLCTCCLFFKDKTVTESLCLVKLSFVMSFKDQGKNSRILSRKSSDVFCRYCRVASAGVGECWQTQSSVHHLSSKQLQCLHSLVQRARPRTPAPFTVDSGSAGNSARASVGASSLSQLFRCRGES